jgi:hypothetical protein
MAEKIQKVKIQTKIQSFDDVSKSLQDIEKKLNALSSSVNAGAEGEVTDKEGKTGDIRITVNPDKSHKLEVKTEEGWKYGSLGEKPVKYIDKPAEFSKPTAIKSGSLPVPDYDSGWQVWVMESHNDSGDAPLKVEHGLKSLPSMIIGYYAPDQSPSNITWFTAIKNGRGYNHDNGIGMYVDDTRVYFYAGDVNSLAGIPAPSDTSNCDVAAVFDDGSVRVLIWK